jgi:alpha-1,6-mannosyltransferase
VLAPGPVETFGLSALEALASGTPVVVHHASALAELVVPGVGLIAAGSGFTFADAVAELLDAAPAQVAARRAATRARAEGFTWAATVAGFLACHAGIPADTAMSPGDTPPAGVTAGSGMSAAAMAVGGSATTPPAPPLAA